MLTVYGDMLSGNCYKIKLLLNILNIPHHWEHIDILNSESQSDSFKSMNPNAKIPVVHLDSGEHLWESNAILNYFSEGTELLPSDRLSKAHVLQWQFFEQYSHEPFIATARYINKYLGLPEDRKAEYEAKQVGGHKALAIMNDHLSQHSYFVGDKLTIADITLFAYTHVAEEGGFQLNKYQNIIRWIASISDHPKFIAMKKENASI